MRGVTLFKTTKQSYEAVRASPDSPIKELLLNTPTMPETEVGNYTAEIIAKLRMGDEGQEGIKAFFEKRKPNWYEKE